MSGSSIMAGVIFGLLGTWMFVRAKREQNIPVVVVGLCLMLYTWFTNSPLQDWGIGALLCGVAYYYW